VLHRQITRVAAKHIEPLLHVALARYRRSGEWFDITPEVACRAVEIMLSAISEIAALQE
jgi:hypothetical protein